MSYIYNLTDTWNSAGTTFNAIKMNVTDTASAAASNLLELQTSGASRFSLRKSGVGLASAEWQAPSIWATSTVYIGSGADVVLTRDAANTLAQRNGTNAQAFRVYNTYTDASNYERGELSWSANEFTVGTTRAGTGTNRRLILAGAQDILLHTSNTARWAINGSGHFLALTDNTYDIGASGANRPRALYVATNGTFGGYVNSQGYQFLFSDRGNISAQADGVFRLQNNVGTDFGRLQFGGTTSSFPALKRNATALETKLADDSAYAPHAMQYLDVTDGVTAPAAATGRARIYVDTADGDLKIIFADGTVKTIVTDT